MALLTNPRSEYNTLAAPSEADARDGSMLQNGVAGRGSGKRYNSVVLFHIWQRTRYHQGAAIDRKTIRLGASASTSSVFFIPIFWATRIDERFDGLIMASTSSPVARAAYNTA